MVPIDIVPDHIPEQHTASQMQNMYLDNSHTIEVAMKDITVRISNDADPVLLTRTLHVKFGIYIFLLTTEYVPVKQHNTIRAINLQERQNTAVTCLFSGMSGKIVLL